jgi:O-antigen ligase
VSESFAGRMAESWEAINSVNQRQNWLWGNGLGAQFTYSNPYYPETEYTSASAHNAYVTYYLNLGIFGLGCILLILWRIFSVTLNGFRASGGQDSQWLFLGANACLVASVIGAFASNVFGITPDAYFSATTAVLWAVTLRLGKLFSVRSMAVAPLGAEGAPSPYAPK